MRAVRLRLSTLDGLGRDVGLFCLAFALLRVWAVFLRTVVRYPDSVTYFDIDFLGRATRLWTVPILYRALPNDDARVAAQTLIGILCWSALAFAVARSMRHPIVARAGALLVLLLGLCIQVTEWDDVLLSESLALSLMALMGASLLWLRLRRTRWTIAAVLVVSMLWVFTRQIQAAVFIPVAVLVIGWIAFRARRYLPVAVAVAVVAAWGGYAIVGQSRFVEDSAHGILVTRVLGAPDAASFFTRAGMPDMPVLQKEYAAWVARQKFLGRASPVFRDPSWISWVNRHWNLTYVDWLLEHPVATIRQPLSHANDLLSGFPAYSKPRPVLPSPVQDALWDRSSSGDLPFWIALALVAWVVSLRRGGPRGLIAVGVAGVAFCAFWYWATWQLGYGEQARHELPVASALRISLFIIVLAALDRFLRPAASPPANRAAPDGAGAAQLKG